MELSYSAELQLKFVSICTLLYFSLLFLQFTNVLIMCYSYLVWIYLQIIIRPGVNLTFLSNSAILTGGGIHVSFPAIRYTTTIFNRLCFIQYSSQRTTDMPPHKWNATVTFADNHAGLSGGAIHVSDMQLCRWIGNEYSRNGSWNIFGSLPPEISPLSPFIYK